MNYRRWTLIGAVVAIVAAIWLIEGGRMMGPSISVGESDIPTIVSVEEKAGRYPEAQELVGIAGYINSPPLKLADFIGEKVILIDFWTYSCINCQRTMPYLRDWWTKYEDDGLLIVGVHTPEFEFEKDLMNVRTAVANFGIRWPVVQDNDYATWRAYKNQYWPRKYLIDTDGYIVYDHIGEGGYEETERKIQELLSEHMAKRGLVGDIDEDIRTPEGVIEVEFGKVRSPETYFGAWRNADTFGNGVGATIGEQVYALPEKLSNNRFYLDGAWNITREYAENSTAGARLVFQYSAKDVNIVAGPGGGATRVRILVDGQPVGERAGRDVVDGVVTIDNETLFNIVSDPNGYGEHTLEMIFEDAGTQMFTFTFG